VGRSISEVLPFAVGVAISPVPIIAVILMLFSARARVNGPMFVAGWVLGVAFVSTAAYLVADAGDASTDASASDTTYWLKLGLGVVLLLLAVRRRRNVDAPRQPRWTTAVEAFTPARAAGLGVLLSAVNPKNLALSIAAGTGVAQIAGLSSADAAVALVVFVVLASVSVALPVLVYFAGGERATSVLEQWRSWLSEHNSAVMAVLLLVFGTVLVSEGIRGLT
jgi:MYXO-CTERM domain-containing protein